MTTTEPTGAAQSPAVLKRELAAVTTAKSELTAREHALRIQIGWLDGIALEQVSSPVRNEEAFGESRALQRLVADAASRGHRVIKISSLTTSAEITRRIAAEFKSIETEPTVLIIDVDHMEGEGGDVAAAVVAASRYYGANGVHLVVAVEPNGLDEQAHFELFESLNRI